MKVVTWNLGYWQHKSHHDEAWAYLRDEIKPDLALLQEVDPPQLKEREHLLFRVIRQNWGTALYTKNMSLEELQVKGYPNRVVAGLMESLSGRRIAAVSVHAPIIGNRVFPYLDKIFDEIEGLIGNHSFVVGGDLNTARLAEKIWPGHGHGPFFERMAKSVFFDCVMKFHDVEQQTFFRKGVKHPWQDDHLFVSRDLANQVKSCYVLKNDVTLEVSDHIPVVAEITV